MIPKAFLAYLYNHFDEFNSKILADKDEQGNTIFHLLANKLDCIGLKMICDKVGRIEPHILNMVNKKGETPLHIAMSTIYRENNRTQMTNFITDMIRIGADKNISDKAGNIVARNSEYEDYAAKLKDIISKENIDAIKTKANAFIEKISDFFEGTLDYAPVTQAGGDSFDIDSNTIDNYQKMRYYDENYGGKKKSNISRLSNDSESIDFSSSNSSRSGTTDIVNFDITTDSHHTNYSDSSSSSTSNDSSEQNRPRDKEADDSYKNILQILIDNLQIDEETAKFYRGAIKHAILEKYPELRKRSNDKDKIKKMEEIINNKKELTKMITKIKKDRKQIEENIAKLREEREKKFGNNKLKMHANKRVTKDRNSEYLADSDIRYS
jgi:hypothetical protein